MNNKPKFGFVSPIKTIEDCPNPAFEDKKLHKVGSYDLGQVVENGVEGHILEEKCIRCGQKFDEYFFSNVYLEIMGFII